MAEPTVNKYQDVLDELNNLMIAIKVSRMDKTDEKVQKVLSHYPLPENEDLDKLHHKINEALRTFDKPLRIY